MIKKIIYLFLLLIVVTACRKDEIGSDENPLTQEMAESVFLNGKIRIKLKREVADRVDMQQTRNGISTGVEALDEIVSGIGIYRIEPTFSVGGRFEKRQREAGLHLWYDIYYDEGLLQTRSATELFQLPEVDHVERVIKVKLKETKTTPALLSPSMVYPLLQTRGDDVSRTNVMPFNDPLLPQMWHYNNTGEEQNSLMGSVKGADIDLFRAWEVETGSPNVIVAIMDGGIQYSHPDIAANMWVNMAEYYGTPGVDDDNNGYIDDVYGVNFKTRKLVGIAYDNVAITQHSHGTHVAGTVSAVTGNGLGIAGIAGGSGKGDGVRLMSCQMFEGVGEGERDGESSPDMYRYAADNGAVISQNSWSSSLSPEDFANNDHYRSLMEAIDYFIQYAGVDEYGNQSGPMRGGLVIFAAANKNTDIPSMPAAASQVLSVAAFGADFQKSSYSNFGNWVTISAPGGEQRKGDTYAILSTDINSSYSWKQGTSMSCPHVSGCAALLLSKYQGQGYTPDQLRERLLNTVGNIDQHNPSYAGELGVGYVRIGEALLPPASDPPATPVLELIASYDSWAIVEWKIGEATDGNLNNYELYWGEEEITESNLASMSRKIRDVKFLTPGEVLRDTINGLELDKHYYYALRAVDRWSQKSLFSPLVQATVRVNCAPVMTPQWSGELLLQEGIARQFAIDCSDPEGHLFDFILEPEISWLTLDYQGSTLNLLVEAPYGSAAEYQLLLKAVDQYGALAQQQILLQVKHRNVAPVVVSPLPSLNISSRSGVQTLNLDDYFQDQAGRKLTYEVDWDHDKSSVAFVQRKDNQLQIIPQGAGTIYVTIRAVNADGMSASSGITVTVTQAIDRWQVTQEEHKLMIFLADNLQGEVLIKLYNVAGREVKRIQVRIGSAGYELDISSLSAGVYQLTLETERETLNMNVVKR